MMFGKSCDAIDRCFHECRQSNIGLIRKDHFNRTAMVVIPIGLNILCDLKNKKLEESMWYYICTWTATWKKHYVFSTLPIEQFAVIIQEHLKDVVLPHLKYADNTAHFYGLGHCSELAE